MKIRTGFVSNSSSSSFLVAYKQDKLDYRHIFEKVIVERGVSRESPFFHIIYNALCDMCSEGSLVGTWKSWLDERREWDKNLSEKEAAMWSPGGDGDSINIKELMDKGFIIRTGNVDSSEGETRHLHNLTLFFKSDDLVIAKQGGH